MLLTVSSFGERFRRTICSAEAFLTVYDRCCKGNLPTESASKLLLLDRSPMFNKNIVCKTDYLLSNETFAIENRIYFFPKGAGSESMGRTIKNELPFPSADSNQMRP